MASKRETKAELHESELMGSGPMAVLEAELLVSGKVLYNTQ